MFFSMPIETLKKGTLASRFTLIDENTPTLTAIYLHIEGGKVAFIGTDQHRIYRYISDVVIDDPEKFQDAIISDIYLKGAVDLIKSQKVDVAIDTSYLVMRDNTTVYFGRLLEGIYPKISHIVDKKDDDEAMGIQVSRGEMFDTLNRMLSLNGVENNRITLEIDSEVVTVHSQSLTGEICEVFPGAFSALLGKLYAIDWVVYCKKPFKSPFHVVKYLSRYTHKTAISNSRLTVMSKEAVTFQYRDYKDNGKVKPMTLDAMEFIRRFMQHVLPSGFQRIRYYGFLSNCNRKTKLTTCLRLTQRVVKPKVKLTAKELIWKLTGKDLSKCPSCGGNWHQILSIVPQIE